MTMPMTKIMTMMTKCPGSIPLPFGQIFEYLNHLYTLYSFNDLKDNVVNDDDENDDNADKMSLLFLFPSAQFPNGSSMDPQHSK